MSFLPRSSLLIPLRLTRRLGRTHALVVTLLGTLGAVFGVGVAVRAAAAALMIAEPGWPPGDELMYGPHLVSATSGSEVWFEDRFSAKVLSGVTYHVKVRNPGVSGGTPVPNFSVKLNGVYYATKDSLTNGATEFTKQVPLQAWNKIELWIAAGSGQVSLEIYSQAGTSAPFTSVAPVKEIRPQAGLDTVNASWQVTLPPDAGPTHVLVIDNGALNRSGRVGCCEWGEVKLNGVRAFWLDTLHKEQSKVMVPVTLQPGVNTLQVIADSLINGAHMHVRVMHAPAASSPPPADDLEWPPNSDVMYGAHTVSATSGSQVWFEDRFSAKVQSGVQYYMKVRNPSLSGGTAVPNFSVKLNGVYYAAKDSLQGGATEFIKLVPLQTWNKIELWIAPGSGKMDLEIYSEPMPFRTLGPVEEIKPTTSALLTRTWQVTKPADAGPTHLIVIDNGAQDRTGRVGANEYGKIKLNGAIVFDVDTFHLEQAKAVVPVTLQAGVNTIEASGGNMGLGERFHVRAMYADTAKPKLVITQPAQNAVVSSPSVTVSGTYQDSTWGEVRVGSASSHATIPITGNGGVRSWSAVRTLVEGPNVIKVWAKDGAGNKADTLVRTVILDTQQPTLTVSAPAEGFTTTESSVTVSGSASDANGVTVTANGVNLPVDGAGNFSGSVPLVVGANAITVVATDGGGNTRSIVRNVTRNAGAGGVTVVVQGLNAGTSIERDECLTIAAGDGAAYECGDLRLVHELPATRTMNKERAPVLLYNSSHAKARAIIAADVSVPAGTNATSLEATVLIPGKPNTVRSFAWSAAWEDGSPRRIAVPIDGRAVGLPTGMYAYTLQVRALGGGSTPTGSDTGTVVVVDRSASSFGAGWWLAGLEQLISVNGTRKLWIGGDGSSRLYVQQGTSTVWLATPTVDRPDTLLQVGSVWQRKLANGAYVESNSSHEHVATVNRQGHRTVFAYGASGLATITLPVPPGSPESRVYTFNVSGTPSVLNSINAPARPGQSRTTTFAYRPGTRWLDRITDPDDRFVVFRYDAADRIDGRQNRRTHWTFYGYDEAELLRQVTVDMTAPDPDIVTTFCPAESRSVAGCASGPQPLEKVYTHLNGPRDVPDTTTFTLTRFGAPSVIVNALGHRTTIERINATFPILATAVVQPNGFRTEATYTDRGLPEVVTQVNPLGDGQNALTRYEWHASWNSITKVTHPELNVVTFDYDVVTGNRLWEQPGSDIERRVHFTYHPGTNLLATLREPDTAAPDSVVYDNRVGNMSHTRTPRRFLTLYMNDFYGRDSVVITPVDTIMARDSANVEVGGMVQSYTYDIWDRVLESRSANPTSWSLDALVAVNGYDEEGNLTRVSRISDPDRASIDSIVTEYRYDPAGRRTAEIAPDGNVDNMFYDPAGNVVTVKPRRLQGTDKAITMEYDTLNRLVKRRLPLIQYPKRENIGIHGWYSRPPTDEENPPYPRYPNNATTGGYDIAVDSAVFTYDSNGNVTAAHNGDAQVYRGYHPNGLLAAETTHVRTVVGADFTRHRYIVGYGYDLNGRRVELHHPSQLAPSENPTRYAYQVTTGALQSVTDALGNFYSYEYTFRGALERLHLPADRREEYGDDDDGNRTGHFVWNSPGVFNPIRQASLVYDARGKVTRTANGLGSRDTLTATYTGLGYIASSQMVAHGFNPYNVAGRWTSTETYQNDEMGNVFDVNVTTSQSFPSGTNSSTSPRANGYGRHTGRLLVRAAIIGNTAHADSTVYDDAGNAEFTWQPRFSTGAGLSDRASYYDAENRLRAADHRALPNAFAFDAPFKTVFEEYRYDALGRRVLVWSRRFCERYAQYYVDECNVDFVRRTVWDGNQEFYEIQVPGDGRGPGGLENDTEPVRLPAPSSAELDPNPFFGRVAYTHGLATDQPIGITRINYEDGKNGVSTVWPTFTIVPLWNSRGQPDMGYLVGVGAPPCQFVSESGCIQIHWPLAWSVFGVGDRLPLYFHGTLTEDKRDKAGTLYRRNRHYDPVIGRFTQEDPIGLAGGMNLYGFAAGDPVNFGDPFGLCVPWCTAAVGAAIGGGSAALGTLWYNYAKGNPLRQNLGRNTLIGAGSGAAIGLGVGLLGGGSAVGAVGAGVTVGPGTQKLIESLEAAGPAMGARIEAVARWLPAGQRALMTEVEGGVMLSGGAGARARQIILEEGGRTVVKAFDVTKKVYETIRVIDPPRQ